MKSLYLLLISLLLLTTSCIHTAKRDPSAAEVRTYTEADVAIVEQLIQDCFDEIWSNLDTSKIDDFHTSDFLVLEHGELWTNDTIINYQLEAAARRAENPYQRINTFDFIRSEIQGDAIWVAYHNYATYKRDTTIIGKGQWLESAVAIETADGWRLQSLHSTRVPQE
jgi:hypothetical protein